jgi:hypothetical protein
VHAEMMHVIKKGLAGYAQGSSYLWWSLVPPEVPVHALDQSAMRGCCT